MSKKLNLFYILELSLFAVFCFFISSCASKESTERESLFLSLLGFISPFAEEKQTPNKPGFESENSYQIHSFSPKVIVENSNFSIEGENLSDVTEEQLFGAGYSKFLQFTEVTKSKITVSLHLCPDSKLIFPSSDYKETSHQISIPCFGSFRYSVRSVILELGFPMNPVKPFFSGDSLDILRGLGEIEFVTLSPLPQGVLIHQETGEITGTPTETTGNEFQSYTVHARLKTDPTFRIQSLFPLIVVSEEEKNNRTCRPISSTSTCMGPSPHSCANSSLCYTNLFGCKIDSKCGF